MWGLVASLGVRMSRRLAPITCRLSRHFLCVDAIVAGDPFRNNDRSDELLNRDAAFLRKFFQVLVDQVV